jgi:glycerol-3-phosphate dehydrogenase
VDAERRSQTAADDQEADAARVAAPDTRAVAVGRALE